MTPETVLVVEDNSITRKMVLQALEREGFKVIAVCDGSSALESFAREPVALVLQDLVLPDVDGFELVQRLRSLPGGGEVPILAFSGLLSKSEEARLAAVGFDDVINKPVESSRLLAVVRAHLPLTPSKKHVPFGEGRLVVVADDDPVQRKLVAFRLQRAGFEVIPAGDGAEALEHARRVVPAAIVSDVLMPRLDGFGLCKSVRSDEQLKKIPVVLTTNSYVETADRELARRVGANDLVLRTPDLDGVMEVLRSSLRDEPPSPSGSWSPEEIESERVRRVMRQLERQVAINAGISQRCALLSAELAVLNGIADALATRDDVDGALRGAIGACLDAAGVSLGALYLESSGRSDVISFGVLPRWREHDLRDFFGERAVLDDAIRTRTTIAWPSEDTPSDAETRLLTKAGVASILLVPFVLAEGSAGALLMMSRGHELNTPDLIMFGRAVAGQVAQALAVAHAFARQRESERVAQEKAALLRSILDSIADAVVVADEASKFIEWNPAAERVMRMRPVDAPSAEWSTKFGVFEADKVTPVATDDLPLVRAIRGEEVERRELYLRHDNVAEGAWLSVNARPWKDEHGRIRGGVAAFRDVTQEKEAQTQLMASDRMASIGMLAAGVAHEINNPLAAVIANLDLAQRDLLERALEGGGGQELRAMIDDARVAADRVRQIVRDLRVFSRHEDVKPGPVDLRRVLESTLRMAWNEIRHRARLVKEYAEVGPVLGTESRLGQLFLNLVVNAAQAIPEGNVDKNTIRVVTRSGPPGRIVVEISDSGSGISPDHLPRLFAPFFTTKPAGVGTGLGLAICQRIVSDLGGAIEVDSIVGRGTTFRVLLAPAHPAARDERAPVVPVAAPTRRAKVLVVDDESIIGTVIRRSLAAQHDVVALTHATEALARIHAGESFDVILCDLMMPDMTGMELHAELAKIDPARANGIIFLTGGAFTPAARAFLDEVPNQRIEKPFDAQHLRALVNDRVR